MRGERDFPGYASRQHPLIKGPDRRVAPAGDQRARVERHPHSRPTTPERAPSPHGCGCPDLMGATPTRAAIRFRFEAPNSGRYVSKDRDSCSPPPGTERSRSSLSRHTGLRRSVGRRPSSRSLSSCSSHAMRAWTLGRTEGVARLKRFRSGTGMVITWFHRVVMALSSWASVSRSRRIGGRTASANWANTRASNAAVLDSRAVALAKLRVGAG